ncbi:TPA: hypothetical protein I4G66_04290 [Enterobacter cloacae]|uniref:hypothetical protein n=1 Tax=Enterobacter cloacae TaxID=550 RepID=UPI0007355329|nr:hypothetical protein [Enterobacter cloacae]KTI56600.1 hypothetical protein ASV00_10170 [Enterobacter cloacae subsp. cloacae]HAS1793223.1 hypothetical protein [Enterobacter cloacae]
MSNIDKQAQYESKFSRLWERYDEASHGNAEQMRDILEVTLDALESAERQIFKLEKLAEVESVGADKAAAAAVEWMKRCQTAEKRIAELESREINLPPYSFFDFKQGSPFKSGAYCHIDSVNKELAKHGIKMTAAAGKGE